ncbi:MAG: hypothetical protein ACQESG_00395 [Nanobdellota archaeon]
MEKAFDTFKKGNKLIPGLPMISIFIIIFGKGDLFKKVRNQTIILLYFPDILKYNLEYPRTNLSLATCRNHLFSKMFVPIVYKNVTKRYRRYITEAPRFKEANSPLPIKSLTAQPLSQSPSRGISATLCRIRHVRIILEI